MPKKYNTKFRMVYVPVTLLLIFGAVMVGVTDFINAGFSLENLDWNFLVLFVVTNVGLLAMIIAVLLLSIDKFKETDTEYNDLKDNLSQFYKSPKYAAPVFRKFALEETAKLKREVYLNKLRKKYSRLKPSAKDLEIASGTDEVAKKKNRYYQKEKRLSNLMSEEYIKENLSKIRVKHPTITDTLVFSGIATNSDEIEYITTNKFGKVTIDLLPKYLLSFAILLLTAVVSVELKKPLDASMVLNISSKGFTIITQIYFAINYSNKYNQEVTLSDMKYRYGVKNSFELWVMQKTQALETQPKGVEEEWHC